MKRKFSNEDGKAISTKKGQKQSVSLSKKAQSSKKPTDNVESPTKKAKKSKFEKPTRTKKVDKPAKVNATEGMKKSFVKKDHIDESKKLVEAGNDSEKPNWLEMKKEKKELKEKRKAKRLAAVYEPSVKAKLIGEKLRRADCTAEEREKLTKKLYLLLKGSFDRAVLTHDLARVVQWLVKYANNEIREKVVAEWKPNLTQMFLSKYAKNCIKKALKHGTEEIRKGIVNACYGNIVRLVSHGVSSPLVDYIYRDIASDLNRIHFKQEFYGDMYKQSKDNNVKTISDVYASAIDMKSATLSAVKINLERILNKSLFSSPIVQAVMVDYLNVCNSEDRSEIIVMLRGAVAELSSTENGAKLAVACIRYGTNKDRKFSLKALKQQVKNVCLSEHGHVLLMAVFDCVDDTVLVKKLILSEILADLVEIASNEYGRRVILYLVAHRDPAHFHPALVERLKQVDDNETSKKSVETRANELLEAVIEPMLDNIAENVSLWLATGSIAVVTLAILKHGRDDKPKKAFEAIADFITDAESIVKEEDGVERAAVEHSGLHMVLKKLILAEKSFAETNSATFGQVIEGRLDKDIIERWINFNRACFLLVFIAENSSDSVIASLKKKLKSVTQSLKTKKSTGAKILLKKIK